jgi:uncharacterized RDD family membrane protein YckC
MEEEPVPAEVGTVPPPLPTAVPPVAKPATHPWLRYWARSFDLFALLMTLTLTGMVRPDSFVQNLLALYLFVPFETALLTIAGTTPGKWLFRIFIEDEEGRRPSPVAAVRRTVGVLVYGLGLLIPVVSLLTQVIGYMQLSDTGTTRWDRTAGTRVRHDPITPMRAALIMIVFFTLVAVLAVLSYLAQSKAAEGTEI